jgi:PAS domain S-box-containing protein/putative nucleotidyltransferase with HDIG domain
MERPLAVLIVEDSASDAALNVRALERAGYKVSFETVVNGAEMRSALERWTFDIVLSDHNLPQFDSIQALALIGEYGLDTPFIIVSGAIGEETAVALMKAGAQDYVMKNNLARLPSVVERALRETDVRRERRRAVEALRESEEKYRSLVESMDDAVFVVDENLRFLYANNKYLSRHGWPPEAVTGAEYGRFHSPEKTREFSRNIKKVLASGAPLTYQNVSPTDGRIFLRTLSPVVEPNRHAVDKVTVISRDITDLKSAERKLRSLMQATIDVICTTVEKRDPYTSGHQKRVALLSQAIAREMELDEDRLETISTASLIHDLGKIVVPVEILNKPTALTETEFNLIKAHSREGYEILKGVEFSGPVARIVLEHHEKLDGSGYPQGLRGEEMLLESRIVAVADVVEAMASHRPYRPALGIDKALGEVEGKKGVIFDKSVVDVCLSLFRKKGFTWEETGQTPKSHPAS